MGFTRGLAAEVGAHGVTANCVSLGTMKTGAFAEALVEHPELEQKLARHYPVPRVGEPDGSGRPGGPAVQRRRRLDHRPGVPRRRRLRLRPVAARCVSDPHTVWV